MLSVLRPSPTFSPPVETPALVKQKQAKKIKSQVKPADLSHDTDMSNESTPLQSPDRQSASIMSSLQPLFMAHGLKQESHVATPKTKKIKIEKESPKKPSNAFMMFCDQYRLAIQEEYRRVNIKIILNIGLRCLRILHGSEIWNEKSILRGYFGQGPFSFKWNKLEDYIMSQ